MRFLWTYLILVIVFAFGFVCASWFTVGVTPPPRARRGPEAETKCHMFTSTRSSLASDEETFEVCSRGSKTPWS